MRKEKKCYLQAKKKKNATYSKTNEGLLDSTHLAQELASDKFCWRKDRRDDEEKEANSYWVTVNEREDTEIWKRKHWIALWGELFLKDEEKDVSSYWMILKERLTEIWKRKHYITFCGEPALEQAMGLSQDNVTNRSKAHDVTAGGTYSHCSNHWALNGYLDICQTSKG